MITYEDTIRKRRAQAYDFFLNVPEKWIDLFSDTSETAYANGVTGLDNPCGSVGCVAHWIALSPEYIEWSCTQYGHFSAQFDEIGCYLGISRNDRFSISLFEPRLNPDIPQKQEALARLECLQTLPIVKERS